MKNIVSYMKRTYPGLSALPYFPGSRSINESKSSVAVERGNEPKIRQSIRQSRESIPFPHKTMRGKKGSRILEEILPRILLS
jgi:hypothetical protein